MSLHGVGLGLGTEEALDVVTRVGSEDVEAKEAKDGNQHAPIQLDANC